MYPAKPNTKSRSHSAEHRLLPWAQSSPAFVSERWDTSKGTKYLQCPKDLGAGFALAFSPVHCFRWRLSLAPSFSTPLPAPFLLTRRLPRRRMLPRFYPAPGWLRVTLSGARDQHQPRHARVPVLVSPPPELGGAFSLPAAGWLAGWKTISTLCCEFCLSAPRSLSGNLELSGPTVLRARGSPASVLLSVGLGRERRVPSRLALPLVRAVVQKA